MIYLNLDSLDTGGYCFGDKIYVRDNLRQIVNKDLYVTYASKIGLDVGTSAIVIFYKGRNITSSLIEELIEKGIVKKADNNELVFLQERKEEVKEWDLYDLTEEDRSSIELKQDINDLTKVIRNCLLKCDSFKGNVDNVIVVDKAYGRYWEWRDEKYFCIFNGSPRYNRNITYSLINRLQELNILYSSFGEYMIITDGRASIGTEYRVLHMIRDIIFFFIPLAIVSVIFIFFLNKFIALVILIGGIIYYIVQKNMMNFTSEKRNRIENIENIITFWFKWFVIISICAILFDTLGIIISIGLASIAILKYFLKNRKV